MALQAPTREPPSAIIGRTRFEPWHKSYVCSNSSEYNKAADVSLRKWMARRKVNDEEGAEDRSWEMASFFNLVVCQMKMGQFDEAENHCYQQLQSDLPEYFWVSFLLAVSKHLRHTPGTSHFPLAESFRQSFLKLSLLETCQHPTALAAYQLMMMAPILPNCLVLHDARDSLEDVVSLAVLEHYHEIPKLEESGQDHGRADMRHDGSLMTVLANEGHRKLQGSARTCRLEPKGQRGILANFVNRFKNSRPNIQHLGAV